MKPKLLRFFFIALVLMAAIGFGRVAAVARVPLWSFEIAVARSELIFIGEVIDIAYRDSTPGKGLLQAPHSFVTYRIERLLRGEYGEQTLTLRLTGGYSPSTGRVMIAPQSPMFRVGDRDVVLIRGNGTALCPLSGCGLGRFRISEGAIFSDAGLAVRIADDGRLRLGPDALPESAIGMEVPPAPEARLDELRRRLEDSALGGDERRRLEETLRILSKPQRFGILRVQSPRQAPSAPPADLDAFAEHVRQLSARQGPPEGIVVSASPDGPLRVPAIAPALWTYSGRPVSPRPRTLEQQLLERNGGNPVLGGVQ